MEMVSARDQSLESFNGPFTKFARNFAASLLGEQGGEDFRPGQLGRVQPLPGAILREYHAVGFRRQKLNEDA